MKRGTRQRLERQPCNSHQEEGGRRKWLAEEERGIWLIQEEIEKWLTEEEKRKEEIR